MQQHDLCVVVPAHNEARVITQSLTSLIAVLGSEHVYVVSDGSTDATAAFARTYVPSVLELVENVGKAKAIEKLIAKYKLTKHYRYILFADADSELSPNFLEAMQVCMKKSPACVVGTVASQPAGFISAYRTYEYSLSHRVYKRAQGVTQTITVAPGCASAYRSDVLEQLDFGGHTLTEDFDLTLQIHTKKLGRIMYAQGARVTTQDPNSLRDYWKQVLRWYTGFWQNVWLHKMFIPKRMVNLEILLAIADASVLVVGIVLAVRHPQFFLHTALVFYLVNLLASFIFLHIEKAYWATAYSLFFPILQVMNMAAFFAGMIRAVFAGKKRLPWNKVARYSVKD